MIAAPAGMARYGFFRDELYYVACGEHLAWGYIDQPPLIALIAWISRHLLAFAAAFRVLPVLAAAATVFLTGWLARELGGGRLHTLAALAILFAPLYLAFDSILTMNGLSRVLACVRVYRARIRERRVAEVVAVVRLLSGVGLENKRTMAVFGFAIVAGFSLSRDCAAPFVSRWIWIGGLIASRVGVPESLVGSAERMAAGGGGSQRAAVQERSGGPLRFIGEQVLFYSPVMLPVWLGGLAGFRRT